MKNVITTVLLFAALFVSAQESSVLAERGGKAFVFTNGITNWSEPVTVKLESVAMGKKGQPPAEITVRMRLKKLFVSACHFEIEVTNKDSRQVRFAVHNQYRAVGTASVANGFKGELILHKFNLKSGQVKTDKIIYADTSCDPSSDNDCVKGKCGWFLEYRDIAVK